MTPKTRVRIPRSLLEVKTPQKGKTALFQEGFAISAKSFVHGRVLGWAWRNFSRSLGKASICGRGGLGDASIFLLFTAQDLQWANAIGRKSSVTS